MAIVTQNSFGINESSLPLRWELWLCDDTSLLYFCHSSRPTGMYVTLHHCTLQLPLTCSQYGRCSHHCVYDCLLLRLILLYISLPAQCPGPPRPLWCCPVSYRYHILKMEYVFFPAYQSFKKGSKLFSFLCPLEKQELMNQLISLLLIPLNGSCLLYPANSKQKNENLFTKPRNKTKQN